MPVLAMWMFLVELLCELRTGVCLAVLLHEYMDVQKRSTKRIQSRMLRMQMHWLWVSLLLLCYDILRIGMDKKVLHEKEIKRQIIRPLIYNNFISTSHS